MTRQIDAPARLACIRQIVVDQAEDEGLWFVAATAPEAYLQQELRRLHAVIEAAFGDPAEMTFGPELYRQLFGVKVDRRFFDASTKEILGQMEDAPR